MVTPLIVGAGKMAAAYAAQIALDYGINHALPAGLRAGRKYTYKRAPKSKFHRRAYKAFTGAEKVYNGSAGQFARGVGNFIGGTLIAGKLSKSLKKKKPPIPRSKIYSV